MKKIKLFVAACAAMLTMSVNAQTWTASEVGAGNYMIYNVGSGQFLTAGNAWGTQASITTTGIDAATQVELIANNGNWFIRTGLGNANYGLENLAAAGDVYMDQSRNKQSTWTFTQVGTDNGPVYNIISAENHGGGSGAYLTANSGNTVVSDNGEATSVYAQWKLLPAEKAGIVASLNRYATVKTAAVDIVPTLDTSAPDAAANAATTAEEIEAAIVTLRAAFLEKLPTVTIPTDPGYIDVTAALVDNAGVRQNTNFWTAVENGSARTGGSWGVCNYNECEFYNNNFKFYQTLALTSGTWEFGVTGFHRAGNHNTHFYAGDDKILIPGVESSVVNTMAQAQTYFDNGNGKVALKFLVEAAGNVEIGIDNQDTQTDKWTIFRDFTLKYFGAPDYSIYEQQWNDAVTAANDALTASANANVTGQERTDLNNAINDAPDGSNKANYLEKIQALEAATQAFTTAAPSYDNYVAYRAETVAAFGEALAATISVPTSAAEANAAVQNLNIAQYNKVAADYTHSLNGLIGDFGSWEGTATVAGQAATPNYLDYEHWSGQTHAYYEQASNGWGNAQGWTIKYEKKCTLPAGDYVIKVAARSSAGTTSLVSCSATNNTVTLPNVGAGSRGINKAGEASWNEGEFVNNGNGFGWQWRFLPFSLSAQTEVTMTFYAETSSQYQWMSIADGELLSANDVATAIAFDEESSNTIEDVLVANVTMTRNIKEGYNTVCLPFTLTSNQVAEAFGSGTEVYSFSENSTDPMQATISFTKGDGSITANVPVLVKATTASTSQTFEGVQIVAASAAKVEGTNFDFVGVYAPTTVAAGDWFIGNGAVYKSAGATSIKAFRAYIDNKSGAQEVKLFIDGLETAISEINADATENGVIYNIAGQRVNKAQKGIYIVNGKKVAVK
jgi:hypothetical protein